MMRSLGGRARAKRHRNLNPSLESLESRLALSRLAGGAATFAESARTATEPHDRHDARRGERHDRRRRDPPDDASSAGRRSPAHASI